MTPATDSADGPDCGVEVVGKGEGATWCGIYDAIVRLRLSLWHPLIGDTLGRMLLTKPVGVGSDINTNLRLTGSPLTARGLQIITEKLEV